MTNDLIKPLITEYQQYGLVGLSRYQEPADCHQG